MGKILVTGACGFIGWKVCEKLLERGEEVLGVDDLNDYYDVRLKNWRLEKLRKNKNFLFVKFDISKKEIRYIVKEAKPDIIINLAARAGVRASIENPDIYYQTNVIGNLNLLECAKEFGIKKFIYSSSSSLYAGCKIPFSEDLPVNEPISPYAASKKAGEITCFTYHYLYGIDIVIFRYFTVYGPAGRPDMSIFKFIKLIDEEKEITVYGDGTQSRDFTYIDDIAEGTISGLNLSGFHIINLGSSFPHSLNEVIKIIEEKLNKKAKIVYAPFPKTDLKITYADITKAKKLLNWEPKTKIEEGIEKTILWYIENKHWLKYIMLKD
ncbi:MAG: GDP-mannose 4,6-dehydratase [Candidatus Omnitrophica bacterium]|nr:GDP-mannose 4,6-dehydratase [Candidatus Omnitrophota bacterium]MCM8807281.1 GDP-mannose 4,6-dehydratase [Candidatus Omnitrophota bacterium]